MTPAVAIGPAKASRNKQFHINTNTIYKYVDCSQ